MSNLDIPLLLERIMSIENKDQEEIQEVIVDVADAKEIFEIKEEQRTTLEIFLGGKDVVALL